MIGPSISICSGALGGHPRGIESSWHCRNTARTARFGTTFSRRDDRVVNSNLTFLRRRRGQNKHSHRSTRCPYQLNQQLSLPAVTHSQSAVLAPPTTDDVKSHHLEVNPNQLDTHNPLADTGIGLGRIVWPHTIEIDRWILQFSTWRYIHDRHGLWHRTNASFRGDCTALSWQNKDHRWPQWVKKNEKGVIRSPLP